MQAKRKVLARHPNARLVVMRRYPDTEPLYSAVFVGNKRLDVNQPDSGESWTGTPQGATAAWRSAYYFLVREASAKAADRAGQTAAEAE